MISLEEAQGLVLERCRPLPVASVASHCALGLVLAEPVSAPEAVPPFDNTAMDGFAVRHADTSGASRLEPVRLQVIYTLPAGHPPGEPVGPGQAVRIMTGAPMPEGADAVVPVENTVSDDGWVDCLASASAYEHVRRAGEDLSAGQVVFSAGEVLGPGHLGVLASIGVAQVRVHSRPKVAVMSTGDELVDGPGPLMPGQIRDSNRITLISLLRRDGFEVLDLGVIPDDEAALERALTSAAESADAVLTSGGVSMGDFDYVKVVLDRLGDMRWLQVAIRPAKPFAFGTLGTVPVFGLPGNPVSSMVSYELLARPGLRRLAGFGDHQLFRPQVPAQVEGSGWRGASDGRTSFVRVSSRLDSKGQLWVRTSGGQGSHQLWAMALADGLAVTPPGSEVKPGDSVGVIRLDT